MRSHVRYARIVVDGFAEGAMPEEIYREVMGTTGTALARAVFFENGIMALIDRIAGRQSGYALLEHLQGLSQTYGIRILPAQLFPRTPEGSVQDAVWAGRVPDAYARTSGIRDSDQRGGGRGSSVKISFDLTRGSPCGGSFPLEAGLFHELVHALRIVSGTQRNIRMPRFERFEEFVAVTLENMYRSETGFLLRGDHGCGQMNDDSQNFQRTYRRFLDRLHEDSVNANLYRNLACLSDSAVAWNPFRGWR